MNLTLLTNEAQMTSAASWYEGNFHNLAAYMCNIGGGGVSFHPNCLTTTLMWQTSDQPNSVPEIDVLIDQAACLIVDIGTLLPARSSFSWNA